jgi:hypothetical protein
MEANVSAVLERLDERYARLVAVELENARLRGENDALRDALREALQWTRGVVGMTRIGSKTHMMLTKWRAALAVKAEPTAYGSDTPR